MAKSLKSKWKRKMRAIKRERYGKKELDRLKKMLGLNTTDVEMKEEKIEDIAIEGLEKERMDYRELDLPEDGGGNRASRGLEKLPDKKEKTCWVCTKRQGLQQK
ncbi:hypothetical protein J6590_027509 [Homalodisca vitripennis]|nr:hypothetical protein J6590_027509 [Homalodisca vitripennis]